MNEQNLENALITAPVQAQERIVVLDIIRGVALLGILLVHMPLWFGTPYLYLSLFDQTTEWVNIWDRVAYIFVDTFVQGKFFPIFSFLFGLGFFIFFERAKERSTKPKRLFCKRLFILLIIGLIHAFFIWFGDVLVSYALLGFLLPLFFNRKPKTILIWAIALFAPIAFLTVLGAAFTILLNGANAEVTTTQMPAIFMGLKDNIESSFQAYGHGTFGEIMAQRASDTLLGYAFLFAIIFVIFPIFLLGLYAGKKGIFQNLEANLPFIRKTWIWSCVIGLSMSVVTLILRNQTETNLISFINIVTGFFRDAGLIVFYFTSITLLFQKTKWVSKLKPFGYVGRMALSNYLLQSIIGTMIFYSYGLGLYGQIAPALGFVLAILIFIIQIIISKWWLSRYQFGPMEWVWRSLTYGKRFKNSKD